VGLPKYIGPNVVKLLSLPSGTVSIYRPSGTGEYVNGRFEEAPRTSIAVRYATVQPFTPQELLALPEGQRPRENLHLFCIVPVLVVNRNNQVEADQVSYNGSTWEIIDVIDWNANARYYHATIARLGQ
jgi:hypothetical protein